ncbi:unnamed protein product [Porites lobata]|uniref:Uncharacterized protein n=1 Tax=Porites lobata TaxID=104759 RepID=A0ABN8MT92_9CNID|nr:unnamed protein product [Porites lobata]
MAAAGTAVCWQTKAIYFELETHMSKSRSITEEAELTQSEDTKLRYLKFWCQLKHWINVYQLYMVYKVIRRIN